MTRTAKRAFMLLALMHLSVCADDETDVAIHW